MSRKSKYTIKQKTRACEDYISGNKSATQIAHELGMKKTGCRLILVWVKKYSNLGTNAFIELNKNSSYTKEFKLMVVNEYLNYQGSIEILANKYNIKALSTVQSWIMKYNRQEELDDYLPKLEVYKVKSRKTTLEERIEIVNWCKEHDNDYKEASIIFNCSYAQIYSWVRKYNQDGEDGLIDRRGHNKCEEDLTSEEILKKENDKLTRKNIELERQIELLKKLNAFEWKD